MDRKALEGSLLVALLLGITVNAQAGELDAAPALYKKHCSLCHGLIAPDTAHDLPAPHRHIQRVMKRPPAITWTVASQRKMHGLSMPTAPLIGLSTSDEHLAFAPPYGPPLRGVYGRQAGSVAGFPYSRAFKETLHGVVWTRERLDVWIADSQAWVPGSRMFYQQPDAEIRRQIITYLEANR